MAAKTKILIASSNVKKAAEMLAILQSDYNNLEFLTLADYPDAPAVEETGDTFMSNAHLKATSGVELSGLITISDDGGLCIDALNGDPGVKSHRFMGEHTSFEHKMTHILNIMKGVEASKRSCRFHCAVVIAVPNGLTFECEGVCEGFIAREARGERGFGYDPIFYVPHFDKHMAELTPQEKRSISHRGKALKCAKEILDRDIMAG